MYTHEGIHALVESSSLSSAPPLSNGRTTAQAPSPLNPRSPPPTLPVARIQPLRFLSLRSLLYITLCVRLRTRKKKMAVAKINDDVRILIEWEDRNRLLSASTSLSRIQTYLTRHVDHYQTFFSHVTDWLLITWELLFCLCFFVDHVLYIM